MVLPSSCRCGAGVKTIRKSRNSSRVRTPALLGCVSCFMFISIFLYYIYIFFTYYTPMEVVPPVGMLVYTAVYTLAADGAVFDTPKKNWCLF